MPLYVYWHRFPRFPKDFRGEVFLRGIVLLTICWGFGLLMSVEPIFSFVSNRPALQVIWVIVTIVTFIPGLFFMVCVILKSVPWKTESFWLIPESVEEQFGIKRDFHL